MSFKTLLRSVIYLASLGLAVHLVLPRIPGIERSFVLISNSSGPLIWAAFLAIFGSYACYAEILGYTVGATTGLGVSARRRKRRGLGRWFMFRLTITFVGIMVAGWGRGAAFAVPADLAWRVAGTLRERGTVKRGYLGILSQPVRLPDGGRLGLTQKGGLLVVGVEDGSPADQGGLMVGDIVATLDGQPAEDTDDLLVLLSGERVGRSVPVKVVRGGEPHELNVIVGERG